MGSRFRTCIQGYQPDPDALLAAAARRRDDPAGDVVTLETERARAEAASEPTDERESA